MDVSPASLLAKGFLLADANEGGELTSSPLSLYEDVMQAETRYPERELYPQKLLLNLTLLRKANRSEA